MLLPYPSNSSAVSGFVNKTKPKMPTMVPNGTIKHRIESITIQKVRLLLLLILIPVLMVRKPMVIKTRTKQHQLRRISSQAQVEAGFPLLIPLPRKPSLPRWPRKQGQSGKKASEDHPAQNGISRPEKSYPRSVLSPYRSLVTSSIHGI